MMTAEELHQLKLLSDKKKQHAADTHSRREQVAQAIWSSAGAGIEEFLDLIGSFNCTTTVGGRKIQIVIKAKD